MVNLLYALHDISQYIAALTIALGRSVQSVIPAPSLQDAISQSLENAAIDEIRAIG